MKKILNKHGMTVSELIITCLIMAMLMGICAQILTWSMRISRDQKSSNVTKQEGLKAIAWLTRDLSTTTSESLYMGENFIGGGGKNIPSAISALNSVGEGYKINPPGVLWKKYVIFYLYPDPKSTYTQKYFLIRNIFTPSGLTYAPLTFYNLPMPITSSDFLSRCSGSTAFSSTNRVCARNITEMKCSKITIFSSTCNSCMITVKTKEKGAGKEDQSSYTITVIMRNTIKQPI